MKRFTIITLLILLPILSFAQSVKPYYIYNIVNFEGNLKNEGFKVTVDNGKTIEKLRDDKGKRIVFTTPAGALMFFFSKGWELYAHGATSEGEIYGGIGASETDSYWIIRRPCTKDEFDDAVKNSIRVITPIE